MATRVLGDDGGIGKQAVQYLERAVENHVFVGGIQEHEAGAPNLAGRALEPADDVTTNDVRSLLQLDGDQVLAQDSKTAAVPVHEGDRVGDAQQRIEAYGASADGAAQYEGSYV